MVIKGLDNNSSVPYNAAGALYGLVNNKINYESLRYWVPREKHSQSVAK